jgi:hypothetical protein
MTQGEFDMNNDHFIQSTGKRHDLNSYCPCCQKTTSHAVYVNVGGKDVPLEDMVSPEMYVKIIRYLEVTGA